MIEKEATETRKGIPVLRAISSSDAFFAAKVEKVVVLKRLGLRDCVLSDRLVFPDSTSGTAKLRCVHCFRLTSNCGCVVGDVYRALKKTGESK